METKYYEIAFDVLNYLYLEPSEINTDKFIDNFNKIMLEDDLTNNYIKELEKNLFNLKDNKGREAYICKNMDILYHLNFFNENKDLLRSVNNKDKEPTVREKMIYGLFVFVFFIEEYFKENCLHFDINYKKLHKKLGYTYNTDDIMLYVAGGTGQPEPENITNEFINLFKHPYNSETKIKDLKDILKTYNYIDNNFKWTGITKDKNELATLYWLFEEKKNILNPGKVTPQLKTFYKEFGLIVYTDKEPKGDCTLKNINKNPGFTDTYKHFSKIFHTWINTI